MIGFKMFFCCLTLLVVASTSSNNRQETSLPEEIGILIVSEIKYFAGDDVLISQRTIMEKGNKIRIDETTPMSLKNRPEWYEEAKTVTISDDKTAWRLSSCKSETLKPITDLLEHLGIRYPITDEEDLEGDTIKVVEKDNRKWYLDGISHCILKEESGQEAIFYKNYEFIEGVGPFPRTIERHSKGKLRMITQVKHIDKFREFSNALFDPEQIKFSERAKEMIEELSD